MLEDTYKSPVRCTCEPEEFEGELVHWSSCPKNEGGCTDGSCTL